MGTEEYPKPGEPERQLGYYMGYLSAKLLHKLQSLGETACRRIADASRSIDDPQTILPPVQELQPEPQPRAQLSPLELDNIDLDLLTRIQYPYEFNALWMQAREGQQP